VRSSEWIAFLYFLYLAVVCWLRPRPLSRRRAVTAVSAGFLALIWVAATRLPPVARDWAPLVYVSAAYYVTGWLFVRPSEGLESWLLAWDRRLLGNPTERFAAWPAAFVAYLEIVYMMCFLLLPGGLAVLILTGQSARANHYWTMVLAADLGAFAPLSVFQTRPPWLVESRAVLADNSVHRLTSYFVENATIRVNTFPSGHVAVSLAIAAALVDRMPVTGAILFALAASVSLGAVVGRYHYVIDILTGAILAAVVWLVVAVTGM
jgi:membrane-associated phospholipid phosphatase